MFIFSFSPVLASLTHQQNSITRNSFQWRRRPGTLLFPPAPANQSPVTVYGWGQYPRKKTNLMSTSRLPSTCIRELPPSPTSSPHSRQQQCHLQNSLRLTPTCPCPKKRCLTHFRRMRAWRCRWQYRRAGRLCADGHGKGGGWLGAAQDVLAALCIHSISWAPLYSLNSPPDPQHTGLDQWGQEGRQGRGDHEAWPVSLSGHCSSSLSAEAPSQLVLPPSRCCAQQRLLLHPVQQLLAWAPQPPASRKHRKTGCCSPVGNYRVCGGNIHATILEFNVYATCTLNIF